MEIVFKISGEGGGICIKRKTSKTEKVFLYEHSEFDPSDEGLDVNQQLVYHSFEEPFQLINNKYPWHMLYIVTVLSDFRPFIADRLIEKLNTRSITPDYMNHVITDIEHVLDIDLKCIMNDDKPNWSYTPKDDNKI